MARVCIEINNLKKSYGDRDIFKGLNLKIHEGERIGLIGLNGSGKTTLLKGIIGQEAVDSGDVHVYGCIGYLPQYPVFKNNLTVMQYVKDEKVDEKGMFSIISRLCLDKDVLDKPSTVAIKWHLTGNSLMYHVK